MNKIFFSILICLLRFKYWHGMSTEMFANLTRTDMFRSNMVPFFCVARWGRKQAISQSFNICSHMLHFSCNTSSPLLTCQSHWTSKCSPSNTSLQYFREEKPLPGHPLQALFWDAPLGLGKATLPLQHVCALSRLLGYQSNTVSVWEGKWSTTAENRGIRCESSEMCHSEFGLYMCYRQAETISDAGISPEPPTTSSWVHLHRLAVAVPPPFANKSKLLTGTYTDWVFSESCHSGFSQFAAASESNHFLKEYSSIGSYVQGL